VEAVSVEAVMVEEGQVVVGVVAAVAVAVEMAEAKVEVEVEAVVAMVAVVVAVVAVAHPRGESRCPTFCGNSARFNAPVRRSAARTDRPWTLRFLIGGRGLRPRSEMWLLPYRQS
jgi:hypothetical protein